MWIHGNINSEVNYGQFKQFDYIRKPVLLDEAEKWKLTYPGMQIGGSMCVIKDTLTETKELINKVLDLKNCGYTFYKMQPGDIMPEHVDHFSTYTKLFNVPVSQVFRAVVFLEDWKSGHYFEIDKTPITNWSKNDYVLWSNEVPHIATNIGNEDRYTLQITGTKDV